MRLEDFDEKTKFRAYFVILYSHTLTQKSIYDKSYFILENIFSRLYAFVNSEYDGYPSLIYAAFHNIVDLNEENIIDISHYRENIENLKELFKYLLFNADDYYRLEDSLDSRDKFFTEAAVRMFYSHYHENDDDFKRIK